MVNDEDAVKNTVLLEQTPFAPLLTNVQDPADNANKQNEEGSLVPWHVCNDVEQ